VFDSTQATGKMTEESVFHKIEKFESTFINRFVFGFDIYAELELPKPIKLVLKYKLLF
jgi:hypothetical protein